MFRASLCSSSGAYQLQQKPLVYRRNVVVAVLLAVVGPARPRPTALPPPRYCGKPEAAAAVDRLLMMGMRMPESCWAVSKRQTINLQLIAASICLIHLNLVLPLERGGSSAVGRGRHDHDQQHCYSHAPTVKPEAATAVVELLMMGVMTPETCWAVHKRQVINLWNYCI